jgi:DNA end-binding protein Ku
LTPLGGRKCSEDFADCDAAALRNKCLSLAQKRSGKPIAAKARPKGENVVDLMDALKRNIANKGRSRTRGNAAANQREARCES